jgi:predicted ATP-binding protein involved in virulence
MPEELTDAEDTKELPPTYFLSLTIENFRCFNGKHFLDLSDGNGYPPMWTVLLGDNGVGKTSLLQCFSGYNYQLLSSIAESLHSNQKSNGKIDNDVENYIESEICIKLNDNKTYKIGLYLEMFNSKIFSTINASDDKFEFLDIFCYGAVRKMGTQPFADKLEEGYAKNLFEPYSELINAEDYLAKLDYARGLGSEEAKDKLPKIEHVLIQVLPDVTGFRYRAEGTQPIVEAETSEGWVQIRRLSLGYQTALAWMTDLAVRMFEQYPDSPNPLAEPAVCLVDEIDLHMHPKWQRELIQKLSTTFPKTQFIVTAHSPLIVQAAPNANIALLRRSKEKDTVEIVNDIDEIRKWRVDQILSSELFGGLSAYPDEQQKILDERTMLVQKRDRTPEDEKRLEVLNELVKEIPTALSETDIRAMGFLRRTAIKQGWDGK